MHHLGRRFGYFQAHAFTAPGFRLWVNGRSTCFPLRHAVLAHPPSPVFLPPTLLRVLGERVAHTCGHGGGGSLVPFLSTRRQCGRFAWPGPANTCAHTHAHGVRTCLHSRSHMPMRPGPDTHTGQLSPWGVFPQRGPGGLNWRCPGAGPWASVPRVTPVLVAVSWGLWRRPILSDAQLQRGLVAGRDLGSVQVFAG